MSTSGGNKLPSRTVTITGDELADVFGTPVELVPAQGAGRFVAPFSTIGEIVLGDCALTFADGGIPLGWPTLGLVVAFTGQPATTVDVQSLAAGPATTTDVDNQPWQTNATGNPTVEGPIATASVAGVGAGYAAGDTGTIDTAGTPATYEILTVGALGVVLTFAVTSGGTGYDIGANPFTTTVGGAQPGVGVGFTVNVDTNDLSTLSAKITTLYYVQTLI